MMKPMPVPKINSCAALEQVVAVALSSALCYVINFDNAFYKYCKKKKRIFVRKTKK